MALGRPLTTAIEDEIIALYQSGLTAHTVAKQLGLSKAGVLLAMHRRGIARRTFQTSRALNMRDYDLSSVKEVLIGEMLGDGALALSTGAGPQRSARFELTVAKHNEAHVYLLAKQLTAVLPVKLTESQGWWEYKGQRHISYRVRLWTLFAKSFTAMRWDWYGGRRGKGLPADLTLTPTICRHWYYGDGSLSSGGVMLCTNRYSDDDLARLQRLLLDAGDFRTTLYLGHHGRRERLRMGIADARRFIQWIGPCELDCYRHKWKVAA
jgi:hypothetical protein